MIPDIFQYYGVDWIGSILGFFSLYLLGNKKKSGFIYGAMSDVSWIIFSVLAGSVASFVANIIVIILRVRGYMKWHKEHKMPFE
jgi:hypothetical protein